ncbi:MAG TPA: HlyD family secretion protein [Sphingomonadaceae bacterium]|nr:HlyD family secretion protein [Sphingomonadaceae bacterium]
MSGDLRMNAPDKIEAIDSAAPGAERLTEDEARRAARARYRKPLLIAGPVVVLLFAVLFYLHGGRYESTDNAYVQSAKVAVSANVSGRVIAVEVANNQRVRAGQVLFRLDPAPYRTQVAEARAKLAAARLQVNALRANFAEGASELAAARDTVRFAERERERQKQLLAEGISSQAQYDTAALAAETARQHIQTVVERNAGVAAQLGGDPQAAVDANPLVRQAQAALDAALLRLSYTVIHAPQAGIVTKVDQLPVGNYVEASRPLFTLVGTRLWIEGNFKENQLTYMREGQPATVRIDAYPGLKLSGRLASFSPGTGNSFALLPAENATGNWVKVVQRLPVEVALDDVPADVPLHAGLSATVTVDTGHRRHLFGGAGAARAEARAPAR